jgi:hypothetical protein
MWEEVERRHDREWMPTRWRGCQRVGDVPDHVVGIEFTALTFFDRPKPMLTGNEAQ